jgi:hypothetical protein
VDIAAETMRDATTPDSGACPGNGKSFSIGPGVFRAVANGPHEREPDDPLHRPLTIFALDPATSRLDGAVAVAKVPYEPLSRGPIGKIFEVDSFDSAVGAAYRTADLEDPRVLIEDGYRPSTTDPRFQQQMVYAVSSLVYTAFKSALGRDVNWGFDSARGPPKLVLRPHANNDRNAFYDKSTGTVSFGYYRADATVAGRNRPEGFVFTSLSHDVIAHEVTHALLDGMRARFADPTGVDVLAFHEAFADLVSIFQHFTYKDVLTAAIRRSNGDLRKSDLLTSIATQFGHTTGSLQPLRTAIDIPAPGRAPAQYTSSLDPHPRGSVLTSAVFDAFATVFERKSERYIRLANGSGSANRLSMSSELTDILAGEAAKLAAQFLSMCIRAIDYCPPVDLHLGEFLRAVITADHDLVPDDPWAYREAWVDAFRQRGIVPPDTDSLSEDALLWRAPRRTIPEEKALSFASLRFAGDPGRAAGPNELERQACVLGRLVSDSRYMEEFGLCRANDVRLGKDRVEPPCVESIRSSRRVGPDGQIVFDLVAEVTQRRISARRGSAPLIHYGGATIIICPRGKVRYVITKNALNSSRMAEQRAFMLSDEGRRFVRADGKAVNAFRLLHERRPAT